MANAAGPPGAPGLTPFVRLALAKLLQLLAQNALIYGLFILVISRQESSLATSAFIISSVLPSVLLSLPGGVIGDHTPVKLTLAWTLLARIAITWAFLDSDLSLAQVLLLSTLVWTVYQFYTPAENAAVLAVSPPERRASATAILQAVSLVAQVTGAGLLAPLTVKLLGEDPLFLAVLLLLAASLVVFLSIAGLTPERRPRRRQVSLVTLLPAGLGVIRRNDLVRRATLFRVVVDSALTMVVVAVPVLLTDVLKTAPENAVYIAAPAAAGVLGGLAFATLLLKVVSPTFILRAGFALVLLTLLGLAFVPELASFLDANTPLPLSTLEDVPGVRRVVTTTLLLLPLGGLGVSLVQVTSRSVVYGRVPAELVAQVFAAQSAIGSLASLLPALLSGLLLDLLPVRAVLVMIALAMALSPILLARRGPALTASESAQA